MTALELREIGHHYPNASDPTLRRVCVQVAAGQLVTVIGPSGSGKSTLVRVAAGLLPAHGGQVLLGGQDVSRWPTERRDLTVMFQQPLLFDHLNVAANVSFAARLGGMRRRAARDHAEKYLRLVHLAGFATRPVASLSGGQHQRVALARALAAERSLLLLDEPFSALDRELRVGMHDLLAQVRAALAPSILLVTHDLDEAALADSTVVLIAGTVRQQAPMAELYRRPASVQVARLLGGFTEVPGTIRGGIHDSSWGRMPVAAGLDDGPAVLMLRREALRLVSVEQSVEGAGLTARVVRRRALGTRVLAGVVGDGGEPVEVELPPGADVTVGAQVRVSLAPSGDRPWAVPAAR